MTTAPFLYLPVEVAARELDAKLLLAHCAAAAGFEVLLGQKWLMQRNIGRMPPGILLFKTMTAVDAAFMAAARAHGHRIAAMDEEIPGLIARNEGLRWVSPAAVEACDLVLAVGDEHLDALLWKHPEHRDKYVVVGNPRWDLLRPEFEPADHPEVAQIRREFGRFILINTNLGFTNSGKGTTEQMVRKLEKGGKFDRRRPADAAFLAEHMRLEQGSRGGIEAALPRLAAAFPRHRIVLRPHPSENAESWRTRLAGLERVQVLRRGSAVAWIMASDLLVHTYCTTGVEAFALGKPALCFRPVDSPVLDNYLSPRINIGARTPDELVERARELIAAGPAFTHPPEFAAVFARSFAARSGPLAADRILQALVGRFAVSPAADLSRARWRPHSGYRRFVLSKRHNRGLMPAIAPAELRRRLDRLGHLLGRPLRLTIETCGDRVFHIHRARAGAARAAAWLPDWLRPAAAE